MMKENDFATSPFGSISVSAFPAVPEKQEPGAHIGEELTLHGSIHKIRKMSGFAFVILRTSCDLFQCILSPEWSSFPVEELKEEMCVRIRALVAAEARSRTGWELRLTDVEVLSRPAMEMPVVINQKKMTASLETMLDHRPLALRNEKERAIFRLQHGICRAFRTFLESQGFTEIHTPKLVSQGAEGGANIFRLDYFGKEAYLAQSPQFYKQMMTGVYERVFEIGPVFRAEKHDTARHLNEYTSVDFEMGYISSFEEVCRMETAMIRYALESVKAEYAKELELLSVKLPEVEAIPSIRFHAAKELVAEHFGRPVCEKDDLEPEEEKLLSRLVKEKTGSDFVFVTHYPSSKRPFYAMEDPNQAELTLSFDLLFRGLEVTTGGQRIHDYDTQLAKMERRGMDPAAFAGYLEIHRAGMPPHGGLGLGLERFVARLLELDNVRRACLFPRDIHRIIP